MAEPFFSARAPWRTPRFQPIRKAEQPCRPSPRASSRFPSVPPLPSLKTCPLGSVSFHTLGLSLFSSSCPSLRFRPVRHGEHLVFSPDARPNSPAARRRAPPPVFPPFHLALLSSHTYTLASLSFHSTRLDLAFFRGRASLSFRRVRHGRTPHFRPRRKAEQPCRPSPCASVPFSLRSAMPFTQDIHITFGVFPHAWT